MSDHDVAETTTLEISVPEQGFRESLSHGELLELLTFELNQWGGLSNDTSSIQINVGGYNLGANNMASNMVNHIQSVANELRNHKALETPQLRALIAAYQKNQILMWSSRLGIRVQAARARGETTEAAIAALAMTPQVWRNHSTAGSFLGTARAAMLLTAGAVHSLDINSSEKAQELAAKQLEKASATAKEMKEFREHHTKLFGELEKRYRQELTLEEPVKLWTTMRENSSWRWRWSLFAFGIAAVAPCVIVAIYWSSILPAITAITSGGKDTFSLAGLALVTVPAVFYGWLVRNVSRIFQQSLLLADDAEYRRTLVLTYLGLAENKSGIAIADADRTLILNALFRPVPTAGQEEGLPAGLLEFLGKKS